MADENDALGRKPGEALWPEYGYNEAWAAETKVDVGTYFWNALYQQHPSSPEGEILKRGWWKFYRERPWSFDEVLQSWDMTFKDSDGSDFVVGGVWGRKGADKYLLDQVRGRMDFPATLASSGMARPLGGILRPAARAFSWHSPGWASTPGRERTGLPVNSTLRRLRHMVC